MTLHSEKKIECHDITQKRILVCLTITSKKQFGMSDPSSKSENLVCPTLPQKSEKVQRPVSFVLPKNGRVLDIQTANLKMLEVSNENEKR